MKPAAWPHDRHRGSPETRGLVFDTAMGCVGIALDDENRLVRGCMPAPTPRDAAEALGLADLAPIGSPNGQKGDGADPALPLVARMRRYFNGGRVEFDWPLNLEGYTGFQRQALSICATIPYGEMRSYGWIADRMGRYRSARPVGQAMGTNRIPILIPCHRVIGANGRLIGYGGGIDWKTRLLKLEGAI